MPGGEGTFGSGTHKLPSSPQSAVHTVASAHITSHQFATRRRRTSLAPRTRCLPSLPVHEGQVWAVSFFLFPPYRALLLLFPWTSRLFFAISYRDYPCCTASVEHRIQKVIAYPPSGSQTCRARLYLFPPKRTHKCQSTSKSGRLSLPGCKAIEPIMTREEE